MTKIKICGLKTREDIKIVNNFCPDYVGFIFAPSKRQISLEQAKELKRELSLVIQSVGVFVNERIEKVLASAKSGVIDMIQLHGEEDYQYVETLKTVTDLPVIKAIRIQDEKSLFDNQEWLESPAVDFILLDTFVKASYGGSGVCFDWGILKKLQRPYFLAGGINANNLKEALSHRPYAIDVSSGVETNGVKDERKVKEIIEQVRAIST